MKAETYPVKALGNVTLNDTILAKGEIADEFGTLKIYKGDFQISDISVYNGEQRYVPQATTDEYLQFEVLSNGVLNVFADGDNAFTLVFDAPQDFAIDSVRGTNGNITAVGTYEQQNSASKQERGRIVKSKGTNIQDLEISGVNCIANKESTTELTDEEVRIYIDTRNSTTGQSAQVYVGNVLVVYMAVIQ